MDAALFEQLSQLADSLVVFRGLNDDETLSREVSVDVVLFFALVPLFFSRNQWDVAVRAELDRILKLTLAFGTGAHVVAPSRCVARGRV